MIFNNDSYGYGKKVKIEKQWQIWLVLSAPSLLIGILVLAFSAAGLYFLEVTNEDLNSYIENMLPVIIVINHTIILWLLIYVLKQNSLHLWHIGWQAPSGNLIVEIFAGLACGLLLYLFKEIIFDSVRALMMGRHPTFTSLFNFQLHISEIPLMFVAVFLIFIEESVFRGFGIRVLQHRYGLFKTVMITSVFFGFLHWGNGIIAILYTGIIGLFYALIFLWRNKNLAAVTVAHGFYNLLILLT